MFWLEFRPRTGAKGKTLATGGSKRGGLPLCWCLEDHQRIAADCRESKIDCEKGRRQRTLRVRVGPAGYARESRTRACRSKTPYTAKNLK